jgi:putative Mg2+ transporter-C (MgtC) family protein
VRVEGTEQLVLVGRIALAAFLGFAIGVEREYRGKSAGERTFALLAMSAAAFTGLAALLLGNQATSRVIQGVATGVGFLGGGLIFLRRPGDVRGLTTAVSAWAATAIGTAVGLGIYLAAAMGTALTLLILELDRIPLMRKIHEGTDEGGGGATG